jgi:antitoxin PrlF
MVNIIKISSKGQVVIPSEIREKMNLVEGNLLMINDSEDSICMKKIEFPKIKSWKEATKPFREAAKKSNFSEYDLKKLIEESRIR